MNTEPIIRRMAFEFHQLHHGRWQRTPTGKRQWAESAQNERYQGAEAIFHLIDPVAFPTPYSVTEVFRAADEAWGGKPPIAYHRGTVRLDDEKPWQDHAVAYVFAYITWANAVHAEREAAQAVEQAAQAEWLHDAVDQILREKP